MIDWQPQKFIAALSRQSSLRILICSEFDEKNGIWCDHRLRKTLKHLIKNYWLRKVKENIKLTKEQIHFWKWLLHKPQTNSEQPLLSTHFTINSTQWNAIEIYLNDSSFVFVQGVKFHVNINTNDFIKVISSTLTRISRTLFWLNYTIEDSMIHQRNYEENDFNSSGILDYKSAPFRIYSKSSYCSIANKTLGI